MNAENIQNHYTVDDLPGRFERTLQAAGFNSGRIDWPQLAPLDQFHVGGLAATAELAESLGLQGGESVLDVGSGFGGPARFLAAAYACHVTGIDLTPSYVAVSKMLGERTGLADRLTFLQGNALELPFPSESFDHAWTQHVAMNIADKLSLYRGIYRVLKSGGRLAIYDAVQGEGGPAIYPVPWAREATDSFLATPAAMADALRDAGFREVSTNDTTQEGLAWIAGLSAAPTLGSASAFNLGAILGADMRPMTANFARNLAENRVRLLRIVVQKD